MSAHFMPSWLTVFLIHHRDKIVPSETFKYRPIIITKVDVDPIYLDLNIPSALIIIYNTGIHGPDECENQRTNPNGTYNLNIFVNNCIIFRLSKDGLMQQENNFA